MGTGEVVQTSKGKNVFLQVITKSALCGEKGVLSNRENGFFINQSILVFFKVRNQNNKA